MFAMFYFTCNHGLSRVLCPARHIICHFRDESFQAINCTGTDNRTQNEREKIHKNTENKQQTDIVALGKKNMLNASGLYYQNNSIN